MNRKLLSRMMILVIAFVFLVGAVQAAVTTYTAVVKKDNPVETQVADKTSKPPLKEKIVKPTPIVAKDETEQVKKPIKKEIDITEVSISGEIEGVIRNSDGKNSDKNIKNYKKVLKAFDVPDKFKKEIERLIKKGYQVPDILTAYDFLYDNYGLIEELEKLIEKKNEGESWTEVFVDFNKSHKEFIPRDFDSKYLEGLLKTPRISPDDIMNADRISQKGLMTFEQLIEMRKEGKTWKEINSELGIVNTSGIIPRISISRAKVKKYVQNTGMSEKKVIDALALSSKMEKDDDDVINEFKSGLKKEDIYSGLYNEKYR